MKKNKNRKTPRSAQRIIARLSRKLKDRNICLGSELSAMEYVSSGVHVLDFILGGRGIPRGRVIELFGTASSGKSTLALQMIKSYHMQGNVCSYVDAEHALHPEFAKTVGVEMENLIVQKPEYGEEAFHAIRTLIGEVDLIVVDSVAALVPKEELEGNIGDKKVAPQARMMSQAMRVIAADLGKTKTTLVFLNQIRKSIGTYGIPETTPGGKALEFYASIRLGLRRRAIHRDERGTVTGIRSRVKAEKNKVAFPFREGEFDIYYTKGISRYSGLLDLTKKLLVVQKAKKRGYLTFGDIEFKERDFIKKVAKTEQFRKVMRTI